MKPDRIVHDPELERQWLEKHRSADEIIVTAGVPMSAVYYNPVWRAEHKERGFWSRVRWAMERGRNK